MTGMTADVVVNGERVDRAAVAAEAQHHTAPRGRPDVAWNKAAHALAVRTLLLQEARGRGLHADPQEVGPGRVETEEEALIRALLDEVVEVVPPGADAVRAEWQRDPSRFRTPPLWEVSHILCACDPQDQLEKQRAQSRAAALTLEARTADGARGFAALAARESDCASRTNGGTLGQVRPGDMVPEFEAAVRTLSVGETTPQPVLTRYGWHVIRLDAAAEGRELPFEAVRPSIAEAMEKAAWARAARAFVEGLVDRATISGLHTGTVEPHEQRP